MDVLMPQLGETVAEGKITKWFKSAGDAVKPGDNLFEIETDKISMEVPATTAGVLTEIRVPGRRGGAGRRGGCGDLRRRAAPVATARSRRAARRAAPSLRRQALAAARTGVRAFADERAATPQPRSAVRRRSTRSSRCARRRAISARRGCRRHIRHAAGAAACRRERHRSVARQRLRPAWPHRRARCRGGDRERRRRAAAGDGDRRVGRAGQGALPGRRVTRKCRSTACARPSPRGWSRPSRPSRISI